MNSSSQERSALVLDGELAKPWAGSFSRAVHTGPGPPASTGSLWLPALTAVTFSVAAQSPGRVQVPLPRALPCLHLPWTERRKAPTSQAAGVLPACQPKPCTDPKWPCHCTSLYRRRDIQLGTVPRKQHHCVTPPSPHRELFPSATAVRAFVPDRTQSPFGQQVWATGRQLTAVPASRQCCPCDTKSQKPQGRLPGHVTPNFHSRLHTGTRRPGQGSPWHRQCLQAACSAVTQ